MFPFSGLGNPDQTRRFNVNSAGWFIPAVILLLGLLGGLLSQRPVQILGLIVVAAFVLLSFVKFEVCLLMLIALLPFDPQREIRPSFFIWLDLARVLLIPGFVFQVLSKGLPRVPRWAYLFWAYVFICLLSGYLYVIDRDILFKQISRLIVDVSFAWMVAAGLNSSEKIIRAMKVLLVVSVPVAIYAIYQVAINDYGTLWYWMYPHNSEFLPWTGRASSFLEHPNHLAVYVNVLIPLGFAFVTFSPHSTWRRFCILATGLLVGCLFLTFSRGGWITLATLAALYIMSRRKLARASLVLLLGALMSILLVTHLEEAQWLTRERGRGIEAQIWEGRMTLMKVAATMFVRHPVLGVGYTNFAQTLRDYVRWAGYIVPCHNLYLQLLSETGVLGFGFFMIPTTGLLITCLRGSRLAGKTDLKLKMLLLGCGGAILGPLIHGFFDVPIVVNTCPSFNELYWLIVGSVFVLAGAPSMTLLKQPKPVPRQALWAERPLGVAKRG